MATLRLAFACCLLGFAWRGTSSSALSAAPDEPSPPNMPTELQTLPLMGQRFLTINTVVRVRQIEVSRDVFYGPDESSIHTPSEARIFREAIENAWRGARITWAISWLALHDEREQYRELRKLIVSYHQSFGDEVTFIPGGISRTCIIRGSKSISIYTKA